MKCEQVVPYIPGFAGGELHPDTRRIVAEHVARCRDCSADVASQARLIAAVGSLAAREVQAPAYLVDSILETVQERAQRRLLPMVPVIPSEVVRVVTDHRDVIASAAGTVLVAAGAAYALWRALRELRPAGQPVTP